MMPRALAHEPEKSARARASSGSPFEPQFGFSRAVRTGAAISVAGTGPIWPDGHVDPDVGEQTRRCLEIIETALAELGAALGDVVRTRIFLVDAADADAVGPVHREVFGTVLPASTIVIVTGLLDPRWRIEIEADAVLDERRS
jgi:enamine deaminase RidA (YjgF/YER057c/UK114 family)